MGRVKDVVIDVLNRTTAEKCAFAREELKKLAKQEQDAI